MSFFPLFIEMQHLKVLLVGGGKIATDKLTKLLEFTNQITVIATEISLETQRLIALHDLCAYQRSYQQGDIEGFDIVIVATDTVTLHQAIYEESRGSRVWVNSVDNIAYCDFIFPSYIKKDELTIAFSTGGASPAFAKQIREYFEKRIPDSVGDFLKKMKALREQMPKGVERMKYFEKLTRHYFRENFK